ncbi:MAG: hypothetical protein RJA02_1931 [Armatimonadota bacterium]
MHGLDLARAVLMLVGVIYHGALLFKTGGGWRIEAESTHQVFNAITDGIHLFRMHAFYLLSGFFVALVASKDTSKTSAWKRISRLAIPMLFVGFTANTLMNQLSNAWQFDTNITSYVIKGQWLGPLWFVGNLIAYYALSPIFLMVIDKLAFLNRTRLWMLGPVLLATAGAMVVAVSLCGKYFPEMFVILHFKNLLMYLPVFVLGLLLHRVMDVFTAALTLRGSLVIFASALGMRLVASSLHFYDIHYVLGETIQQYFALAVALAVIAMFNQLAKPGPVLKYFVDASYTLYLVHMPVIVVLHTLLASLHLHWSIEYPVIVSVTSGLCLLFHHQIVARVPLAGFLLNGTKLALKSGSNQVITAPVTS